VFTRTNLLKAAAVIEKCTLYIGNDSGQMHMAAALGVKTIGLFGPTPIQLYRPWGINCSFVCTDKPQAELKKQEKIIGPDALSLMETLSVEKVITAIDQI
jgi:lipopolysaccharide export system permease protein